MPEYLDDPSVLTKEKLKSELLAHNVELPSGNPTKDVYVQLYLKKLTAQNKQHVAATTLDAFSSDEELPPPVVSNRSRSSSTKAARKMEQIQPDELDVTLLTDQGLRDKLLVHGVDVGPIVASTRKLYEKKLQKLLEDGPGQPPLPQLVLTEIQVNHNSNCDSEIYSDKEEESATAAKPEPVAEPEPVPVVKRVVRSQGKMLASGRPHSSQQHTVEKIAAGEQTLKVDESDVLKELLPNNIHSPSGLTATCRRPIKGAAGRPVKSSDFWNDENGLFSPKTIRTSSSSSLYTERLSRVSSPPSAMPSTSSSSRLLSAVAPAAPPRAAGRGVSVWIKLFLLAIVAAFLFLVYQSMETNAGSPFPEGTA